MNCTPATPTLSDAVAEIVTVPATVVPPVGAVSEIDGAVVSGTVFDVVTPMVATVALPAASRARADRLCDPLDTLAEFHENWNGLAVSSTPTAVPSTSSWTPATPTLSVAVTETVIVPDTAEPLTGLVIVTAGGVV